MSSTNGPARIDESSSSGSTERSVRRRTFVVSAVCGSLTLIAGCVGDDGNGDDGGDPAGDGDGNDNGDSDGNDGDGDGDGGNPDSPDIDEPESYIMEQHFSETDGEFDTIIYEAHGNDLKYYGEGEEDQASYIVDGDMYSVIGDQCTVTEGYDSEDEDDVPEYQPDEHLIFEFVESDTLDGVDVDVYRLGGAQEARYYVDPERNLVLRTESDSENEIVTDFHSFNEVDPIEPPDMECQSLTGEE